MRPEAKFEAVIEAGRVILPQKSFKILNEAAVASKHLRRHPVSSWFRPNLCFWKSFWIWLHRNKSKIQMVQKSYFFTQIKDIIVKIPYVIGRSALLLIHSLNPSSLVRDPEAPNKQKGEVRNQIVM